jgi:hypothetical protein
METVLYIFSGIAIGVGGVLAIQALYNWIAGMHKQVERIKWDLEHYSRQREDWVEFNFWRNEKRTNENRTAKLD